MSGSTLQDGSGVLALQAEVAEVLQSAPSGDSGAASPEGACTIPIYENTASSTSYYAPGASVEVIDFGTSPGGMVCRFGFAYATTETAPVTLTIRFYSGTTASVCPGTFLGGWTFPDLASSPDGDAHAFSYTFTIPAGQEFVLPPGPFGYSYTMTASGTGPLVSSGGSGNEDRFWRNCTLTTFTGPTWAGFYMDVRVQDPTPATIRVSPTTLDFACPVEPEAEGSSPAGDAEGVEALTPPEERLIDPEGLIAGAFQAGQDRVDVIVNLVPPRQLIAATDFKDLQSLRVLQQEVSRRQDAVLNLLPGNRFNLKYRYDNIASFSGSITQRGLDQLLAHPRVESIQPVRILEPHLAQGIPLMNALVSRSTYDGSGIAVAIVDTGLDYTHPRLGGGGFPNSKVIGGYNFGDNNTDPMDCNAHGTACAGLAAGDLGTVGDYIGGVAPGAKLYALKISGGCGGSASEAAMVAAWDWCVTNRNADPANPLLVISTSFGGGRHFAACDTFSPAMTAAAANAAAAGITVLASAGNDGFCDSLSWPACISSVISVGAVYDASFGQLSMCVHRDSCAPHRAGGGCAPRRLMTDSTAADRVTSYSNTAGFLDILAPSNRAYTTDIAGSGGYSSGDYVTNFGGTSAACPYAAGAVAALQHASHELTGAYLAPAQVRSTLAMTGDLVTDPKVAITKPRVNLGNALASIIPCAGRPLAIHNDGAQTLEVSAISGPSWVTVDSQPPYAIAPFGQTGVCVTVDYAACSSGQLSGTLAIHSNDAAQPVVYIDIVAACPPVAPASAAVAGEISCDGEAGTLELSVTGGGGDVIRWFAGSCGGMVVGTGSPLSIPAPHTITTYYARWENACGDSVCASALATVPADFNQDGGVDGDDFAVFMACATGANVPYDPENLPPGCTLGPDGQGIIAADLDGDGDVDQDDFGVFQRCYTGDSP